jgi:prevent-host-death family protein
MAERSIAAVLKTVVPETVPGVRIPLPPPFPRLRSVSAAREGFRHHASRIRAARFGTNPVFVLPVACASDRQSIRDGYNSHMKRASISEAKNQLSALVDSVKAGASVLIVDRGRPVARLEPVNGTDADGSGRLARLVRAGLVRPARGLVSKSVLLEKPPKLRGRVSVVERLLEDRREGR